MWCNKLKDGQTGHRDKPRTLCTNKNYVIVERFIKEDETVKIRETHYKKKTVVQNFT
jgi:hypothetical protein